MATEKDKLVLEITVNDKGTPVVKNFRKVVKDTETDITKGSKKMSDGFTNMWKQMAVGQVVAQGVMRALREIGGFLVNASNLARDAAETHQKFEVVFSDSAEKAAASVQDLHDNWGLAKSTAEGLLSSTGDLLTGLGLAGEVALDLSEKTNKLAIDLASFTNFQGGATRASEALTKAMLGERESVKALGIVITEEMVKEELLRQGKADLTGQTLLQAKAEATLEIALSQSKNAIGDYARTSDSLANKQRLLDERLKEVSETLGEAMNPALETLLDIVSDPKFIESLKDFALAVGETLGVLIEFGAGAVKVVGNIVKGWQELIQFADEATSQGQAGQDKMIEMFAMTGEMMGLAGDELRDFVGQFIFAEPPVQSFMDAMKRLNVSFEGNIEKSGDGTKKLIALKEELIDLPKPVDAVSISIEAMTGLIGVKLPTAVDLGTDSLIDSALAWGENEQRIEDYVNVLLSAEREQEEIVKHNKMVEESAMEMAFWFQFAGQMAQELSGILGDDLANALTKAANLMASIIAGDIPGIIGAGIGIITGLIEDVGEAIFGASDEEMARRQAEADKQAKQFWENRMDIQEKAVRKFTQFLKSGLVDENNFNAAMNQTLRNFATLAKQGKSFPEIFDIMGEQFDILAEKMKELGVEGNETFDKLMKWREFTKLNKVLLDGINALSESMKLMAEGNMITTQDAFNDFQTLAISNYDKLIEAGATENQALLAMLPTLRILNELQEKHNFELDERTQKMIDIANQDNLLDETDNMKEMVRLLGLLVDHFVGLTGALADAAKEAGKLNDEIGGLGAGGENNKIIPLFPEKNNAGFARGVDNFKIPPGFPDDSFRVGLTSGEEISVRRPGQSGRGNVSLTANTYVTVGAGADMNAVTTAVERGTIEGLKKAYKNNDYGLKTTINEGIA